MTVKQYNADCHINCTSSSQYNLTKCQNYNLLTCQTITTEMFRRQNRLPVSWWSTAVLVSHSQLARKSIRSRRLNRQMFCHNMNHYCTQRFWLYRGRLLDGGDCDYCWCAIQRASLSDKEKITVSLTRNVSLWCREKLSVWEILKNRLKMQD